MKHPDIEDFIDAIVTVIREQNIEDAVKMEPVHSLTDILALRKITHLRKIARIFQSQVLFEKRSQDVDGRGRVDETPSC